MSAGIELDKLLDIALGTPEVGAVNFNVLHGVLAEIIRCLGVEKKVVELKPDDTEFKAAFGLLNGDNQSVESLAAKVNGKKWSYNDKRPLSASDFTGATNGLETRELEKKISNIENRLSVLDQLPDNTEILKRAREKKEGRTPVGDIWQFININRRLSATETGIEKVYINRAIKFVNVKMFLEVFYTIDCVVIYIYIYIVNIHFICRYKLCGVFW